jgi:hypothetical protein
MAWSVHRSIHAFMPAGGSSGCSVAPKPTMSAAMQWRSTPSAGSANCQFDHDVAPGPEPCRNITASLLPAPAWCTLDVKRPVLSVSVWTCSVTSDMAAR